MDLCDAAHTSSQLVGTLLMWSESKQVQLVQLAWFVDIRSRFDGEQICRSSDPIGFMCMTRVFILTSIAMIAFAGNSLLCRLALKETQIDPATFTSVRLISGALVLWLITMRRRSSTRTTGDWLAAVTLFIYAAAFSYSYVDLPAATGALLLFGAVQVTMIGYGLATGERLGPVQWLGVTLAFGGLVGLQLPGLSAPPVVAAAWMLAAGVAWGVYSIRGKGANDPATSTAGNFLRAAPIAFAANLIVVSSSRLDPGGIVCGIASGAVTSGMGYAIWYSALRELPATHAATAQLSVPVLAAAGGVTLLGEDLSFRLVISSVAILGGVAIVLLAKESRS